MEEEQSSGRGVFPPIPRLRDSCDACAASKVKCDKVKPSCSRCMSRDTQCIYRFAKRSGRQKETETTTAKAPPPPNPEMHTPVNVNLSQSNPTMSHANPAMPDVQTFSQLSNYSSSTSTPFAHDLDNLLSSFPSDESYTSLSSLSNDIFSQNQSNAECLDLSFMEPDNQADVPIALQTCCFAEGGMSEQPPQNEQARLTEAFPALDFAQNQHNLGASYKGSNSQPNHFSSNLSHDCAAQAINHLGQIFPCDISDGSHLDNEGGINLISSVIASNKGKIEAVSKLLGCYCMEDGYLLMIISIIILKLLDRYSAAIHRTTLSGTESRSSRLSLYKSPIPKGGLPAEDDNEAADQCRLASQLILSDLQRVQGLIGLLTRRCETYGSLGKTPGKGISILYGHEVQTDREGGAAGFSSVLRQIEDVLRKRVRVLSTEIIDLLRRE